LPGPHAAEEAGRRPGPWGCAGGGEVAVGLLQELSGVGLLVEAPHEEAVGPRRPVGAQQLVEEAGRQGALAGAAEADEGQDAAEALLPGVPEVLQLRVAADEVRRRRKRVDNVGLRGMGTHVEVCCEGAGVVASAIIPEFLESEAL
jgi:hypothetical protein